MVGNDLNDARQGATWSASGSSTWSAPSTTSRARSSDRDSGPPS